MVVAILTYPRAVHTKHKQYLSLWVSWSLCENKLPQNKFFGLSSLFPLFRGHSTDKSPTSEKINVNWYL